MSRISLAAGSVFAGDYRVVRPLGDGGMGAVYVVQQLSTGRRRALKVMHAETVRDAGSRRRFEQEARVGAAIKSDHVVEVLAAGVDEASSMPWLVMELLDGEDLAHSLRRRGSLPLAEIGEIFAQLCHALAAAHSAGVVHRDLKPENIFIAVPRQEGKGLLVKVLDFGIAKVVGEAQSQATGAIGTPHWMAPEQTATAGEVSPAADIWPLGLIAFRLLTGRIFWRGDSPMAVLREVAFEPLPRASQRAAELGCEGRLPPGFDAWFDRCVARDPRARFRSAAEARDAFRALVSGDTATLAALTGPVAAPEDVSLGTGEWLAKQDPEMAPTQPALTPVEKALPATTPVKKALPVTTLALQDTAPALAVTGAAEKHSTSPALTPEPPRETPPEAARSPEKGPSRGTWLPVVATVVTIAAAGFLWSKGSNRCPPGSTWDGTACVSSARAACPPGTRLDEHGACVGRAGPVATGAQGASDPGAAPGSGAQRSCPAKMAFVPGGSFRMGERPDTVTVPSLCMDVTEVTVAEYASCIRSGACAADGITCLHSLHGATEGRDRPINCVTFDQAERYCGSLGKRLPSEEEWEWAARGGTAGRLYPWGDAPPSDQLCWMGAGGELRSADQGPCAVGQFPSGATVHGLLDMAGNVFEWTASSHQPKEGFRSCRGGSYVNESAATVSVSFGLRCMPTQRYYNIGFRCAAPP